MFESASIYILRQVNARNPAYLPPGGRGVFEPTTPAATCSVSRRRRPPKSSLYHPPAGSALRPASSQTTKPTMPNRPPAAGRVASGPLLWQPTMPLPRGMQRLGALIPLATPGEYRDGSDSTLMTPRAPDCDPDGAARVSPLPPGGVAASRRPFAGRVGFAVASAPAIIRVAAGRARTEPRSLACRRRLDLDIPRVSALRITGA
jgi:hypothetical protein